MISTALVADAIIGNVQEKKMKQHHAGNAEVIFYSYFIGTIYLLIGLVALDNFWDSVVYFSDRPDEKYGSAFLFSISGYLGMQIVLTLVRAFGAFVTVTVTSFRKALTIVMSFLLFSKPFTMNYVYSGLLVLLGVYLNLLSKETRSMDTRAVLMKCINFFQRKQTQASTGQYNV